MFTKKARSILKNTPSPFYHKNDVIIKSGQAFHWIFCVQTGKVKIMSQTTEGQVLVGFAGTGDLVGLSQLMITSDGYFTAIAMEDVCGCFIRTDNFRKMLSINDPEFSQKIIAQLIRRGRDTEKLIGYMSAKKSVIKFCGLIKEMIEHFGLNTKNELELSLTIKEWAELANLQRETLQRMKKQLENAKLLKWHKNSIEILSVSKLDEIILKGKLYSKNRS